MAFTNLTPVSFQKVGIRDGFWKKRIHAVCTETARLCIDQCEKTHRIDNFRRAAGWQAGGHEGIYFNDSDVYKVLEGVAYVLMTERDEKLEAKADEIIDAICAFTPQAEVDYIHGEAEARALCQSGGHVGFLLPALQKADLFDLVSQHGPLPRKAFSMGEADEKRCYLEARSIDSTGTLGI